MKKVVQSEIILIFFIIIIQLFYSCSQSTGNKVSPQGNQSDRQLDQKKSIQELYVKSGLSEQLPHSLEGVNLHLKNYESRLPKETFDVLKKEILNYFDYSKIEESVLENLEKELDIETTQAALRWLNSPLGQEITRLEIASSTKEGLEELMKFLQQTEKPPISSDRQTLLKKLITSIHAVDATMNTTIYLEAFIIATLIRIAPETVQVDPASIPQRIELQRSKLRPEMEKQILSSFAYIYRSLGDEELQAYLQFAETPSGQSYHLATLEAVKSALSIKDTNEKQLGKMFPQEAGSLETMMKVASEINKNLPLYVDSETILESSVGHKNRLEYRYRLTKYEAHEIEKSRIRAILYEQLRNNACSSPDSTEGFLNKGISLSYSYYGNKHKYITSITITPKDCEGIKVKEKESPEKST